MFPGLRCTLSRGCLLLGWLLPWVLTAAAWSADTKHPPKEDLQEIKKQEAAERAAVHKHLGHAKVSLGDAVKTALSKLHGKAVEAYFEVEGKALLYEVEVIAGGKHQVMVVDADSGHSMGTFKLDKQDKIERDMKEEISKAKVSIAEAIDTALKKHPSAKAFDVHPDKEKDRTVIEVELLDGKKMLEVFIDAASGAVLAEKEFKE